MHSLIFHPSHMSNTSGLPTINYLNNSTSTGQLPNLGEAETSGLHSGAACFKFQPGGYYTDCEFSRFTSVSRFEFRGSTL
jgi:hypothetical protein